MARTATAKTCFVIMPFSETKRPKFSAQQWTDLFDCVIRPAVEEAGYVCTRSQPRSGNFLKGILASLNSADIVLADLTGKKANVFYELGIRHSLRLRTILCARAPSDIPSDLRSYWCEIYDCSTRSGEEEFKKTILQAIARIEENPEEKDSPVFDYLEIPPPHLSAPITLRPGLTWPFGTLPGDARRPGAFASVEVFNAGPMVGRAKAWIQFYRQDGSAVFADEMPARWSGAPEPLSVVAVSEAGQIVLQHVPDMTKVPAGFVSDLAPKEADSISVAVKFFDDQSCWGWTPDSYMYQWQHPVRRLPADLLLVRVRVLANGVYYPGEFLLDTRAPAEGFVTRTADTNRTATELSLTRDLDSQIPEWPTNRPIRRRL